MRDYSALIARIMDLLSRVMGSPRVRHLKVLSTLPWRSILIAVGSGFLVSSLLSTVIGELLLPRYINHQVAPLTREDGPRDRVADGVTLDKEAVKTIIKRNIFNIEGKTGEEDKSEGVAADTPIKTTLPLQLIGVIYSGDPYSGVALIKNTSKNIQNSFFVGDDLLADAKIIEIQQDRVILQRPKHKEFLELEKKELQVKRRKGDPAAARLAATAAAGKGSQGVAQTYKEEGFERDGTNVVISTDFRQKLLTSDFAKVLQDAKAEPNMVGNELNGFRLNRIRPDSIYEKAGLIDGDVIKEINGVSLVDPGQAIKLLNSLRGENEIEIRLERGGAPLTLTMKVK